MLQRQRKNKPKQTTHLTAKKKVLNYKSEKQLGTLKHFSFLGMEDSNNGNHTVST